MPENGTFLDRATDLVVSDIPMGDFKDVGAVDWQSLISSIITAVTTACKPKSAQELHKALHESAASPRGLGYRFAVAIQAEKAIKSQVGNRKELTRKGFQKLQNEVVARFFSAGRNADLSLVDGVVKEVRGE
jgi:hypothetical protein